VRQPPFVIMLRLAATRLILVCCGQTIRSRGWLLVGA
jgi:hypothetical protein